jgi:hypothetical protein
MRRPDPYGLAFVAVILAPWLFLAWLLAGPRAETIWLDQGGLVRERAVQIATSGPVEIAGLCASACTMHLRNGCVYPGAVLVFHGPRTVARFDEWSAFMASYYPSAIAAWFMATGRWGEYRMTGAQAVQLGARGC